IRYLKKYADVFQGSNDVHEKFKNYIEYRQLVSRLFYLSKSSGRHLKSQKDQLELENIMKHPLLANKKCAISISALFNFLLIHSYYHDIKKDRDLQQSIKFNMERLKLLETHIDYAAQYPAFYVSVLHNLLLNAGETFNLDLFKSLLEKIKNVGSILNVKLNAEDEKFRNITYLKYSIFQSFISADFQEGINFIKGKEQLYYDLHEERGEEEVLVYCHNVYSLFFGVADYKKCLYWINKFMQSGQETLRTDLWMHVNWTNIIIQIELKNFEFAASLVLSFIRFLSKRSKEFIFEKQFARTLKRYIDTALNDKKKEQLDKLKQLKEILDSNKKAGLVSDADFVFLLPWLKSKIEKRSFLEMYKKSLKEFGER
ncbi:MAG TPA: hypothetical protein VLB84_11600, partial [Bacteroidia bacterium]|nr:hypothetical protein [Bacteroidia bacterium]